MTLSSALSEQVLSDIARVDLSVPHSRFAHMFKITFAVCANNLATKLEDFAKDALFFLEMGVGRKGMEGSHRILANSLDLQPTLVLYGGVI